MRVPEEAFFPAMDGTRLFYRHWPAANPTGKAIVLLHRGHEHSGRFQHVVDELDLPTFDMFAWDARGHGRSYDPASTDSPNLGVLVKDLDTFVKHVAEAHGIAVKNVAVVSQSVGSVLAAAWVHDFAPKIRSMVMASPAFAVKLYVPLARLGLSVMHALFGNFHVNSYVKAKALTHDPERIASYETDPLIRRPISVKLLLGLFDAGDRLVADAAAIQVPTQVLISGSDWVVQHKPQHDFFDRLGSAVKEKHFFNGFFHDTLGEKDRKQAIDKVREFLVKTFTSTEAAPSLADADRKGFTKDEFDRLQQPLPLLSPKGWSFGLTKLGMKTGGRLSRGIRLGLETGFDSGSTLDYIYRNEPKGFTPIGTLIDWFYLNAIGWRGIRIRKQNLEALLRRSIELLSQASQPVRITDIAAGHGRYVLDAIKGRTQAVESVLFRDYSDTNVQQGKELIRRHGLNGNIRFEKGDAFDRASVAAIDPKPTLCVVSGLYELFPDNDLLRKSLGGLADAMERGGYLVYTGQPWHPQLEMIARTLPSHRDGAPWVMRRRAQAELDQLVEAAGFQKVDQLADEWGIFTVSLARRSGG
ncbi:MAG: bifunctional alpha/beta hydrolase/class I SAM-dependent methyltransferase [Bryobacteraceae bacterium]